MDQPSTDTSTFRDLSQAEFEALRVRQLLRRFRAERGQETRYHRFTDDETTYIIAGLLRLIVGLEGPAADARARSCTAAQAAPEKTEA